MAARPRQKNEWRNRVTGRKGKGDGGWRGSAPFIKLNSREPTGWLIQRSPTVVASGKEGGGGAGKENALCPVTTERLRPATTSYQIKVGERN